MAGELLTHPIGNLSQIYKELEHGSTGCAGVPIFEK
jgi:hypothetical protein